MINRGDYILYTNFRGEFLDVISDTTLMDLTMGVSLIITFENLTIGEEVYKKIYNSH